MEINERTRLKDIILNILDTQNTIINGVKDLLERVKKLEDETKY